VWVCDGCSERLLFISLEIPNPTIVFRLALDTSSRIVCDLVVVDSDTENERQGCLPTVARSRLPTALASLRIQPSNYVLFDDVLCLLGDGRLISSRASRTAAMMEAAMTRVDAKRFCC
jgi:hypothetical protein